MPKQQEHTSPPRDDQSQGGATHHGKPAGEGSASKPAGASGAGSIEGLGGTGGSSGAGAARVRTGDLGEISGIDADAGDTDTGDVHETASGESGSASGYRRSTSGNSGIPGQTRGPLRETIPDAEDERDNPPPNNRKKWRS
ncbi:MAG: hypothetical protein ACJ8CR_07605 [Roseiflexaceae bacterium]